MLSANYLVQFLKARGEPVVRPQSTSISVQTLLDECSAILNDLGSWKTDGNCFTRLVQYIMINVVAINCM